MGFIDKSEVPFDELDRKLTAIVSGFDGGYHTESNNLHTPKKSIPITTHEILAKLKELKEICNKDNINRLFRLISSHANDYTNPHKTDLTQFATDILHLLYQEYTNRGGVATYDGFLDIIFEDYRIAGLDDVIDGTDTKLLMTVSLASKYINMHNEDVNAHAALFEKMFPGEPVLQEPSLAIMAYFQIDALSQKGSLSKYSYVGKDRKMYLASDYYLPIDFTYGVPAVALFSDRTNEILWSDDFNKDDIYTLIGLTINKEDTNPSILEDRKFTKFTDTVDTDYIEHTFTLNEKHVEAKEMYNYSIFIKPIHSRYYRIRIIDKIFGVKSNYFINLNKMKVLTTDVDNNTYVEYIQLFDDTYRFQISYYNEIESDIEIEITPYLTPQGTPSYKGVGTDLFYGNHGQFEKGFGVSPFIPTNGIPVTRYGTRLELEITDDWYNQEYGALKIDTISPIAINYPDKERTLFCYRDEDGTTILGVYSTGNIFEIRMYNEHGVQVFGCPVTPTSSISRSIAFGYDVLKMYLAAKNANTSSTTIISTRKKTATILDIGHNNNSNFYEGYFKTFLHYNHALTEKNITFLAGD